MSNKVSEDIYVLTDGYLNMPSIVKVLKIEDNEVIYVNVENFDEYQCNEYSFYVMYSKLSSVLQKANFMNLQSKLVPYRYYLYKIGSSFIMLDNDNLVIRSTKKIIDVFKRGGLPKEALEYKNKTKMFDELTFLINSSFKEFSRFTRKRKKVMEEL